MKGWPHQDQPFLLIGIYIITQKDFLHNCQPIQLKVACH